VPALARAIHDLASRRASVPPGFERESLMARLHEVYAPSVPTTRAPSLDARPVGIP
jgi:hypothetical protein